LETQSRTKIFSQLVRDYMRRKTVALPADRTVSDLLAAMTAGRATSALVTVPYGQEHAGRLCGIVTEHDVLRRIALRVEGDAPVSTVMTSPVQSIGMDDYLYFAIARMRRFGWRHMPVIDSDGFPVGVINLTDALAVAGEAVVEEIDLISREGSLDGLREIKAAQVALADRLFADSVPAPEIQQLLTHINNDIHRRIIESGLEDMRAEGWGEPPVNFCLIIMGSGGRGENFLYPDQDNGFILDDYPDEAHGEIDPFFIELAERMNRDLDEVGFPYCNGYVMARNPLWRKTRSQWREQVQMWGRKRGDIAIQLSDIFFDFRGAYGEVTWAQNLRRDVNTMIGKSPFFLRAMLDEISRASVALGWFGRLLTEKDKPEHRGEINLKHRGTLPLVSNIRLLALKEGVVETGTLARIDALYHKGVFDKDEWDYLRGAFDHITTLLLRQQLRDFVNPKRKVGNYVHPNDFSERERDMLVSSFEAIDDLSKRVRHDFTGEIF